MTPEKRSIARKLLAGMIRSAPGIWEVDGDRYVLAPSGNFLSARSELGDEVVDARWVISRGRKLS